MKHVSFRRILATALFVVGAHAACAEEGEPMTSHHARKPIPSASALAQLPRDGGAAFNRLVFEKSPYLLQHAANPVDWHPWGEAAFEQARREDKPVFLSVGYTTCHWCHVMERECFEDEEVAALMNENFVCVKVDREERPDVDKVYMDITQAMTGSGGWPMTVVMTPDGKPFFAGTYFPKHGIGQRPGMMELVPHLAKAWREQRDEVVAVAGRAVEALKNMNRGTPGTVDDQEAVLALARQQLGARYDGANGGFADAPKFLVPHNLSFLLRYWKRTGDQDALAMVEHTLVSMRRGGVYDHVGYGFHRYATDPVWLLPHFEKMLYDQALMALAYLDAYQATGKPFYADTAREIFDYVLRDMTSPEGGFYSAEDADSEGEEGLFYIWSTDEVNTVLGAEDGSLFIKVYGLTPEGNFKDQSTGRRVGASIPHLQKGLGETAEELGTSESDLRATLERCRAKLFEVRERRVHPQKDDKVLSDWNGLMIAALARGGQVLGDERYREAAVRAADFVLTSLRDDEGRLMKRYRDGEAGLTGHLEDYAFFGWGLIELYEATFDTRYLEEAQSLTDQTLDHFRDADRGGFYLTADDSEALLVRAKELYDGAIPSGNSVAALNLIRLSRFLGRPEYERDAAGISGAFAEQVNASPSAFTTLMQALEFSVGPSFEVVLTGEPGTAGLEKMVAALRRPFLPAKVVLLRDADDPARLGALAPYVLAMEPVDGEATAYVCRNFACELPTTNATKMLRSLRLEIPDGQGVELED